MFKKDSQSAAIKGNQFRWPKATIPYVLTSGDFSISLNDSVQVLTIGKSDLEIFKNINQ